MQAHGIEAGMDSVRKRFGARVALVAAFLSVEGHAAPQETHSVSQEAPGKAASRSGDSTAGPQDTHGVALALVLQLEQDTSHRGVVSEPLTRAREAIERATRLRFTGDEKHAALADGLATEWAETARDLIRAVEAEGRAAEQRRKAMDTQARLERLRALVEEGIARVGRLNAEIAKAERDGKPEHVAVEVHDGTPPVKGRANDRGEKKAGPP
ncbi:MAG: hypothetical protein ABSC94_26195 [Polyangiaceae bacterium]|jgi:hypothetical protein